MGKKKSKSEKIQIGSYLQVMSGPEPSRPRPRPRPTKTRTSALNSAAVRARYGMSDATIEAHRAASAERRKSTVYGGAALVNLRDTISTGVKTATDTGKYVHNMYLRYLHDVHTVMAKKGIRQLLFYLLALTVFRIRRLFWQNSVN